MTVNLSVKNVPDDVAEKLRQRAKTNHRSLQGELLAVLQEAVSSQDRLSIEEFHKIVRASGLRSRREAAKFVREDRDAR